ncbi:hypothetical protein WA158_001004 [Blastocystis sp. Blastoise]
MNRYFCFLLLIATCNAFYIQSVNGSYVDQVFIVRQRQLISLTEIKGTNLDEVKRVSLQKECSYNVFFDGPSEVMNIHDVSEDKTTAYVTFTIITTEEIGIWKVCLSTEEDGPDFHNDAHIDAAVISMFQLCHTFGATAKAIRNCVKSSENERD